MEANIQKGVYLLVGRIDVFHLGQKEDDTIVATYGFVVKQQGEGISLHFPNRKVADSFLYRNFVTR